MKEVFGKNKKAKRIYIKKLKRIFLKKTAFTLNECSIKDLRPNLDLSKYLFFLLAYSLFIEQFLIIALEIA